MNFTIDFNSGGNHGHQIKDAIGGLTIGELFNLNYIHTPYKYLSFFAIGYDSPIEYKIIRRIKYRKIKKISGPLWNGINNYNDALELFKNHFNNLEKNTLIIFNKALRIHPFQTIPWYNKGLIKNDIFSNIQSKLSNNFINLHALSTYTNPHSLKIAIHINRGLDYDREKNPHLFKSSFRTRHMFPLDYFENIINQLEEKYGVRNTIFYIYTEKLNSEEICIRFKNRNNIKIMIGSNRSKKNYQLIHSIFSNFITSDILVCSNSSFSSVASYYRKGKQTIYHPHAHLNYLPEPEYIKTDQNGNFNSKLLHEYS